jgi:hypothetical protein
MIYRAKHSRALAIGFAIDPLSPHELDSFRQTLDSDIVR